MPTIIYPPSIPWSWMFQRPQQLLGRFSASGQTVLYEDLGIFSKPGIYPLSQSLLLCQGTSALTVSHQRPRILWLTVPSHINLIENYDPDLVVYDAVDEPKEEFASWAPYYPTILEKSDLIICSSGSIYDYFITRHPHVSLVPNGVDYVHFSPTPPYRPTDLPTGKPIVGYSGAIAPWIDWELLKVVIKENPGINFVFLGALFQLNKFPLQFKNAFYLGLKSYQELPTYLHHFDIGLIPFLQTEMTRGCNPIKLYEYYAAGIRVLGTPLPELLTIPKINLESNPHLFSLRLRHLLEENDLHKGERMAYAQTNDWSERAGRILQHIFQTAYTNRNSV
ncbi:glycosyltransferase family 1 protein [Desulfosporosinus sp.]|uniref:glycosyltransferase family 1 protein n=1 Tax=Desulfosporosinus sp. TaxID=157907 RepID=UPI0025BA8D92|nr:glycosyltransferase family 1 protein [Desulfosporosinus sp.]MBC2723289.1 glycosyltransferase family 1 protein [Desulfosporosinus sp.]MBC2728578.1 glycosyltransferase family 1 protein [Desulfosporosinus sp.]